MSDIEWGAEIEVNGVRPEWLRNGQRYRLASGVMVFDKAESGNWRNVRAIQLPADHPHYKTLRTSEEALQRMEALARRIADVRKPGQEQIDEARAIVALLDPVDPALEIMRKWAPEKKFPYVGHLSVGCGAIEELTRAALERGRQLEREGK